jgi:hypothetical protein
MSAVTPEMIEAAHIVLAGDGNVADVYLEMKALDPEVDVLRTALDIFQSFGCPVCSGDCAAANPPVIMCPMRWAREALSQASEHSK